MSAPIDINPQLTGYPENPLFQNWNPLPPGFVAAPSLDDGDDDNPPPPPPDDHDDDEGGEDVVSSRADFKPSDIPPTNVTIPTIQIPCAPDGVYFSGTFFMARSRSNGPSK